MQKTEPLPGIEVRQTQVKETGLSKHSLCDPEKWVDLHGNHLYRYALLRLRDPAMAEEMVQETMLAALQSHDRFAGQSSERTWLIGILKHKIMDHFRRVSREAPARNDLELLSGEQDEAFLISGEWVDHWKAEAGPIAWTADPSAALEQQEFWKVFERSLSTLPQRLARVFILREVEELDTEEICETLNITASNLWVMLHRARTQLRRSLETSYFAKR